MFEPWTKIDPDIISEENQIDYVKKTHWCIKYIVNPTERVQLAAIKKYWLAIIFIKNPTERVQIIAIEKSIHAIKCIENPTQNALDYHKFIWEM